MAEQNLEETMKRQDEAAKSASLAGLWQKLNSVIISCCRSNLDVSKDVCHQLPHLTHPARVEYVKTNLGVNVMDKCLPILQQIQMWEDTNLAKSQTP